MFPAKYQITAVNKGSIKTSRDSGRLTASAIGGNYTSSGNASIAMYNNSQYSYMMSGLLPATPEQQDSSSLAYFYRDIYLHDNVAGSCVDILSTFPFSDFELRGLEDNELHVYETAMARLNIRELLPQISTSFMVDGFYAGSLIYDAKQKNFMDVLTHEAMGCAITHSPFHNADPVVRVSPGSLVAAWLASGEGYASKYMESMPAGFVDQLQAGAFTLQPAATLYLARKALPDRAYTSYLHRVLPMYLIEKAMYRGTLVEANRRQRAMSHVAAGDDLWTPTAAELRMYAQAFQDAEQDPMGGWIVTRNAVQVSDLRPAGDFWKWTDMVDTMVQYKLRALGISEALLSGDACLVGDTKVTLADSTCVNIEDLCPVLGVSPSELPVGEWFPLEVEVKNRVSDCAKTKAWSYQGHRDVFEITTDEGHCIRGTDNHPFWVMDADTGECSWKRLDELKEGDLVAVRE